MNCLKKGIHIIFILLISYSCNTSKSINKAQKKTTRILFIGNSLTYTNDLPKLVETVAQEKGLHIKTKTIAFPNYALMDHWGDGIVQKEIQTKKYDFVIVQQGPSSQAFGKKVLIDYGKKFSDLCRQNNAQLCFFMVWPSRSYYNTFDGVVKNYSEAARLNNALLLPVGEAWRTHFNTTKNFDYYSNDGFHPTLKGSRAAAKIMIEYIFGK
ncbi:SGNH/GDSL hydrolase family protein [Winogradskyella sp.]|uniref:SGNH/GDSL hydrolase family protein n=1 Tax=Winogradskyella sp. TaxID=1883156 RepID=UPI003BAC20A4